MTLLMLLYLIYEHLRNRNKRNIINTSKSFVRWFFVYVVIESIVLMLNGEYSESEHTKMILAYYLNCIVTFFAFEHFLRTTEDVKKISIFISLFLVFNCSITILQYLGNPIGKLVALALTNTSQVEEQIISDGGLTSELLFGEGRAVGLFNFTFINANFIGCITVLLVGYFFYFEKFFYKLIILFVFVFALYACMTTQGRVPFIMLVIMTFYVLIKSVSPARRIFIVLFGVALLLILLPAVIETDFLGRISNAESYQSDIRSELIWPACIEFIYNHVFLGGPVLYSKLYPDLPPHNFFLKAFINSGLFGGIVATLLFFWVIRDSIKILLRPNPNSALLLATAAGVMIYSVNSLFHNQSIISGDTLFFILYPLMKKVDIIERKHLNV